MITTKDCKKAIVDWMRINNNSAYNLFVSKLKNEWSDYPQKTLTEFDRYAQNEKEWKRFSKNIDAGLTNRIYSSCILPFWLKVLVQDDGNYIVNITLEIVYYPPKCW